MAYSVDPKEYVAGSSSLVMGCDSYTSPTELGDTELIMGQNVTCRGGIVQTRPGSKSYYCMPDGNLQGFKVFIPDNGVAHHVFAVDGAIYVSAAPFTSYRRLWNLQFSKTAKYVSWAVCLKSTDYDNEGTLFVLDKPYSVLIIQDGLTRAGYWDGGNSGHLNPAAAPFPDNTDVVPGFNETPIGLWMIWSGNRLWVSRGNQIFAGDIGNPMKFTETLYLNEGRAFNLSGPCTGMIEVPADAAGAKGFIAFTETDGTLFASYIQDRTTWLATPLFQNTILPQIGCVAPRSLITQYGLNWWFGPRGFTNINSALRQNITSRIDYQDNEMFSSKAYLGPDLSRICGSFYENYLMLSVPSGDVLNRHTWVLDQAPFENNAAAWPGFWTGWRPVEWSRGIINGSERIFFASIDYDGKNRVWEAMLPEKTDNGCRITCYAQLREHAAGNLNQKKYDWSKFFLSQIYGEVDLNLYVASTKGSYQFQKNYHIVATAGQIFADQQYSEAGPLMMGNTVQTRTIRTPSGQEDNDCNRCGVESVEGNLIDYAFTHLLVWSGQMGIKAYQMHMIESPERQDGDCEEAEVQPRTLNAAGCSALDFLVSTVPFDQYTAYAEGTVQTLNGGTAYIRRTSISSISQENAQAMAECAVQQTINRLSDASMPTGVYGTDEAEIGNESYVIINSPRTPDVPEPHVSMACSSESGVATLCGYSEFGSPSTPPKKYLRCDVSGYWGTCNYPGSGPCSGNTDEKDTQHYSGSCIYDPSTCIGVSTFATRYTDNFAATPCSQPQAPSGGSTPLACNHPDSPSPSDYITVPVITSTPTQRKWDYLNSVNNPPCSVVGSGQKRTWYGEVNWVLSVEDTEASAIARATTSPGTSCTALRQLRGASQFSLNFASTQYMLDATDLVTGIEYVIKVDLVEEDYGGGGFTTTTTVSFPFHATGPIHSEIGSIDVPSSGRQITAKNPRIEVA